jgi:hypothetical protein
MFIIHNVNKCALSYITVFLYCSYIQIFISTNLPKKGLLIREQSTSDLKPPVYHYTRYAVVGFIPSVPVDTLVPSFKLSKSFHTPP